MRQCDVGMLRLWRRLDPRWTPRAAVFTAVVQENGCSCSVPLLAWLLEAGCRVEWPAALAAAEASWVLSPAVTTWLQERSRPL
jgi:hypothetical protein